MNKISKFLRGLFLVLSIILLIVSVVWIVSGGFSKKDFVGVIIPPISNDTVIEDPVPVVRWDTVYIYKDSIKEVEVVEVIENPVNSELLAKYNKAVEENDRLKQLELYEEAVTERQYIETLEDSVQLITVKSEVVGILKRQEIKYKIKQKKIVVLQDVQKSSLYLGASSYMPVTGIEAPVVGFDLLVVGKSGKRIYKAGFDTQKRLHFGITFKLF